MKNECWLLQLHLVSESEKKKPDQNFSTVQFSLSPHRLGCVSCWWFYEFQKDLFERLAEVRLILVYVCTTLKLKNSLFSLLQQSHGCKYQQKQVRIVEKLNLKKGKLTNNLKEAEKQITWLICFVYLHNMYFFSGEVRGTEWERKRLIGWEFLCAASKVLSGAKVW